MKMGDFDMVKKQGTVYVCQECGYESPKWQGQCICGAWNSMVEEKMIPDMPSKGIGGGAKGKKLPKARKLEDIGEHTNIRIDTGIKELNRVLGGGLVEGSLTLISGEPGIGKSTLIIQVAASISGLGKKVLYVSGEESVEQIKMRADRVCGNGWKELMLLSETNIDAVLSSCETEKPDFLIIDSIQTMYHDEFTAAPGSVSQVRAVGASLMKYGKDNNIPIFIIAHVTKSGELAGPKLVEHLVDCVLHFYGERNRDLRLLRSNKNRFGTTSELGAFEMTQQGLLEIENLSGTFLDNLEDRGEGSVAAAIYQGTRPLLLEVQALTAPCAVGFARRTAIGVDNRRLSMIIAVLERKIGVSFIDQDIYVNIVGGLKPEGTATDLAVALAIYSSFRSKPVSSRTLVIGEIGLTGELRAVSHVEKIVKEAVRMGFETIVVPEKNIPKTDIGEDKIKVIGAIDLSDAVNIFA